MKIKLIGEPKVIMSNEDSKFNYFAWPTAKRLQNGKIAVAASGFRIRHVDPFGKAVISFSEDEGETFTRPAPVIDTVLDDRDSGLCPFGESGLILTTFNDTCAMQRIANNDYFYTGGNPGGDAMKLLIDKYLDPITPEEEAAALGSLYKVSYDCGTTFGKLMKSPVTSPHGPIELQDGSILWVGLLHHDALNDAGTVVESDEQAQEEEQKNRICAYKINVDGTNELLTEIDSTGIPDGRGCFEPYAVQLKDGTILCHVRIEPGFTLFQTVSKDGGKTWSPLTRLLEDTAGAPGYILEHSSGVLIGAYSVRIKPHGSKVMFSHDGGQTWDTGDYYIHKDTPDLDTGYPTTVELSDGSLLSVFYAHPEKDGPAVIMAQKWTFEE